MPTECVMAQLLQFAILASALSGSASLEIKNGAKLFEIQKEKTDLNHWTCPQITDIKDISCTCDVAHTVRCRGIASEGTLLILTKKLANSSKPHAQVSLLDLSIHSIKTIEPDTFKDLTNLMGLVISAAGLRTIHPEAFGKIKLAALGLPDNNLSEIPADSIKSLTTLAWLDLSGNTIKKLRSHGFPSLVFLENLNLENNNISIIETEAFGRLPHLNILNLAKNNLDIAQINERSLFGLRSLSKLNLSFNLLKGTLSPTFLSFMPTLKTLDLSHNFLKKIPLNTLSNSINLVNLDISNNKIEVIEDHAFKKLIKLQKLELSHNNIVAISGFSFAHLPNLQFLSLADNSLFAVTGDLLHQLSGLHHLDLASNDITQIQPDVFNYTKSLNYVDLSENPLHCDCTVKWLASWLKEQTFIPKSKNSFVCTTPINLENTELAKVEEKDLVCNKDTSDYYHDSALEYDEEEPHLTGSTIILHAATWTQNSVKLVWNIDKNVVPYTCKSVHIYEVQVHDDKPEHTLLETVAADCSSEEANPYQATVLVPTDFMIEGKSYRYCLVLRLHSSDEKDDKFGAACSEPALFTPAPVMIKPKPLSLNSLTAGVRNEKLVVQTKFENIHNPCSYIIYILKNDKIKQYKILNCSQNTYSFSSLDNGSYKVCAWHLTNEYNSTTVDNMSLEKSTNCTYVKLRAEFNTIPGILATCLFTLSGLGLFVTIYVIGMRLYKSGGIPWKWKWDPRARKRASYFLYTGENPSPNVSLDPLPLGFPESTTRV